MPVRNLRDVCHHFICDYIEDGKSMIKFVHSEEKKTDLFTKNLSNGIFQLIISGYLNREWDVKNSMLLFKSSGTEVSHIIDDGS